MGADLYIRPLTEPRKAKYEKLFLAACERRNSWRGDIEGYQAIVATGMDKVPEVMQTTLDLIEGARAKLLEAREAQANLQKEVDRLYELAFGGPGYFRDSYNGSNMLCHLGLSWWQDIKGGKQTVESLETFLDAVKKTPITPITLEWLKGHNCEVDDGENSVKGWNKYFRGKRRRLIAYLERAIKHAKQGGEVYFSL